MNKTLITLSMAATLMISGCASHKAEVKEHKSAAGHTENGPAHWGEFSATCAEGKSQSPISKRHPTS